MSSFFSPVYDFAFCKSILCWATYWLSDHQNKSLLIGPIFMLFTAEVVYFQIVDGCCLSFLRTFKVLTSILSFFFLLFLSLSQCWAVGSIVCLSACLAFTSYAAFIFSLLLTNPFLLCTFLVCLLPLLHLQHSPRAQQYGYKKSRGKERLVKAGMSCLI